MTSPSLVNLSICLRKLWVETSYEAHRLDFGQLGKRWCGSIVDIRDLCALNLIFDARSNISSDKIVY